MPPYLPTLAACLIAVAPSFLAANTFILLLYAWVDRRLRSDRAVLARLGIGGSGETFGWTLAPADVDPRRPIFPLIGTALAAIVLTVAETALFAATSDVPHFWYLSGTIALLVAALLPFIVAALLRNSLARRIDLMLAQRANDRFAFAFSTLFTVYQIDALASDIYASLALQPRGGALEGCRRLLIDQAGAKADGALPALIELKSAAERDLDNLRLFAAEIRAGRRLLERVESGAGKAVAVKEETERVAEAIQSRRLAQALEAGQWSDATLVIETIRPDLDKLSTALGADSAMPQSVEEAYQVLNVRDDTPLESIKAIVNSYWRIWHSDLARTEAERALFTLKMQKFNVAWGLIQQARGVAARDA